MDTESRLPWLWTAWLWSSLFSVVFQHGFACPAARFISQYKWLSGPIHCLTHGYILRNTVIDRSCWSVFSWYAVLVLEMQVSGNVITSGHFQSWTLSLIGGSLLVCFIKMPTKDSRKRWCIARCYRRKVRSDRTQTSPALCRRPPTITIPCSRPSTRTLEPSCKPSPSSRCCGKSPPGSVYVSRQTSRAGEKHKHRLGDRWKCLWVDQMRCRHWRTLGQMWLRPSRALFDWKICPLRKPLKVKAHYCVLTSF